MRSVLLAMLLLICLTGCNGNGNNGNGNNSSVDPRIEELAKESIRLANLQADLQEKIAELDPGPEQQKLAGPLQQARMDLVEHYKKVAKLSEEDMKAYTKFEPEITKAHERTKKAMDVMKEKVGGGKKK